MSRKHPFIVIEGVDYSGKSTVVRELRVPLGARVIDGVLPELGNSTSINRKEMGAEDRYLAFTECNRAQGKVIEEILEGQPVVQIRYMLSTIASHNVLLSRESGQKTYLERGDFSDMVIPDLTVQLLVTGKDLEARMAIRPPQHKYESDTRFLLRVQNEQSRILASGNYPELFGKFAIFLNRDGELDKTVRQVEYEIFNL